MNKHVDDIVSMTVDSYSDVINGHAVSTVFLGTTPFFETLVCAGDEVVHFQRCSTVEEARAQNVRICNTLRTRRFRDFDPILAN